VGLCSVVGVWYIMKKHWLANDLLGNFFIFSLSINFFLFRREEHQYAAPLPLFNLQIGAQVIAGNPTLLRVEAVLPNINVRDTLRF
jgi:hypothetical protein